MGVLKIHGLIRLDQFWPRGKSAADVSKIKITVDNNSFQFQNEDTADFEVISLFNDAYSGQGRKKQKLIKRGMQIEARLQGTDAPELHYKLWGPTPTKHPTKKGNLLSIDYEQLILINNSADFRQPMAETASVKLLELLSKSAKAGQVACTFLSTVNRPEDACDVYGRFVGDVFIEVKNKRVCINHWLLEKGFAFPALYSGMATNEIKSVLEAAQKGRDSKSGVYALYKDYFGVFDNKLRYRNPAMVGKNNSSTATDKGHLIHPKIYRRWCVYHIYKMAKVDIGTFSEYLKACGDMFYYTTEYLKNTGKQPQQHFLHDVVKGNRLIVPVHDIVFIEKEATIVQGDRDE